MVSLLGKTVTNSPLCTPDNHNVSKRLISRTTRAMHLDTSKDIPGNEVPATGGDWLHLLHHRKELHRSAGINRSDGLRRCWRRSRRQMGCQGVLHCIDHASKVCGGLSANFVHLALHKCKTAHCCSQVSKNLDLRLLDMEQCCLGFCLLGFNSLQAMHHVR